MTSTRRDVLTGIGLSTAVAFLAPRALPVQRSTMQAQDSQGDSVPPAYRGRHVPVPLPFDPKSLRGLSERLVVSHHENNYGGALRNLNGVEAALAGVTKDTPPFVVAGLEERALTFANSVTLHELYFGNLGGDGEPSGAIATVLGETYGTLARWEGEFRAACAGLAGGSGWVVLDLELATSTLRTHASGNHAHARAGALPLLVMDMYEHAYHMDYGAAAARYVDAFFENVHWEEVERRWQAGVRAARELTK